MSFEQWYAEVNSAVQRQLMGLGVEDLPDWNFRDAYEAGMSPEDAAEEIIAENLGEIY